MIRSRAGIVDVTYLNTNGAAINPAERYLSVCDLTIRIGSQGPALVEDVSFDIARGETLAIVGESGSGKSLTSLAVMGLLPNVLNVSSQSGVKIHDSGQNKNLLELTDRQMRRVRGGEIGMIFQEPMTSLNPLHSIEKQLTEGLSLHQTAEGQSVAQQLVQGFVSKRISKIVTLRSLLLFVGALLAYVVITAGIGVLRGQGALTWIEQPEGAVAIFLYALTGLFSLLWSLLWFVFAALLWIGAIASKCQSAHWQMGVSEHPLIWTQWAQRRMI